MPYAARAVLGAQAAFFVAIGAANIRRHADDVEGEYDCSWLTCPPMPPAASTIGASHNCPCFAAPKTSTNWTTSQVTGALHQTDLTGDLMEVWHGPDWPYHACCDSCIDQTRQGSEGMSFACWRSSGSALPAWKSAECKAERSGGGGGGGGGRVHMHRGHPPRFVSVNYQQPCFCIMQ